MPAKQTSTYTATIEVPASVAVEFVPPPKERKEGAYSIQATSEESAALALAALRAFAFAILEQLSLEATTALPEPTGPGKVN